MKYLFLLMLSALCLFGCSKKDDVTNPQNDELITGKWESSYFSSTGSDYDSLYVQLNLKGKDGSFSGDGQITYAGLQNLSKFRYNIVDNASGTYSDDAIDVTVISTLSGKSYNFLGTREDLGSTKRYVGKVTLFIDQNNTVVYKDIPLIKLP